MSINFIALLVAALVPMALGFVWYHPKVFGSVWMTHAGMTDEKMKSGNMILIFGLSFVFSFMLAVLMNSIASHDGMVSGALYYVTNGTLLPEAGSEAAQWLDYYVTNLSDSNRTFKHGAFHGFFIAGLLLALPIIATNALFERKSFKYVAVNSGYWITCLTIMGGIVAAWK